MGVIRAGGLASGIDTNSLIESLMEAQKQPIYRLQDRGHLISLEKSLFRDVNNDLTSLRSSMLSLRMESTFKAKAGVSSSTSVANARVTPDAVPGTHTVEVLQTATNSSMTSKFLNSNFGSGGTTGATRFVPNTMAGGQFDQQEGVYNVDVSRTHNGKSLAASTFTAHDGKIYAKTTYGQIDNTFINSNGTISASGSASISSINFTFSLNGGAPVTITSTEFPTDITDINVLMDYIEDDLNKMINRLMGTVMEQYVCFRADFDPNTNRWTTAIYNTSEDNFQIGVDSADPGDLAVALGLDKPSFTTLTKEINKYVVASDHAALRTKLESIHTSVVYGLGIDFTILPVSNPPVKNDLTDGRFTFIQDASLNTLMARKATTTGAVMTANTGSVAFTHNIALTDILTQSGITSMGKGRNADQFPGIITINGARINLDVNPTSATVQQIMDTMNSALVALTANATMVYDSVARKFEIRSTEVPPVPVKLGGPGDTSNFLDMFKLRPVITTTAIFESGLEGDFSRLNGSFTINGVRIDLGNSAADRTINEVMAIVNSSGAGVMMSYDHATKRFILESNETGASRIQLGDPSDTSNFFTFFKLTGTGTTNEAGRTNGNLDTTAPVGREASGMSRLITTGIFSINGVPIYVDSATDSMNDLIRKVNSSGAGVTMTYDSVRDKIMVTSRNADLVTFGGPNDTSNALYAMNITRNTTTANPLGTPGQNAIVKVDGQTFHRDSNTVSDVITGVTITLAGKGITTIEITVDTTKAVDALATFIKGYNSMMEKLSPPAITREERRDYMDALTQERKNSMTDDDIKEYMARYDALHTTQFIQRSSELRSLQRDIRANIMNPLMPPNDSRFRSLSDIGFRMAGAGDPAVTRKGLLMADSTDIEVIRQAIQDNSDLMDNLTNDSDQVHMFFSTYREETVNGKTNLLAESWTNRYIKMITAVQDPDGPIGLKTRSDDRNRLDNQLRQISRDIETQNQRMESYLEMLWRNFTHMETRVAQINSQAEYVMALANQASNNNR